jgi:hypothetical protein
MDVLQTVLGFLGTALRAVWPGAAGAALAGFLGLSVLGSVGFFLAAGAGAYAGTWFGHRTGLLPVGRVTASRQGDLVLYAVAAFILICSGFLVFRLAMVVAAVAALVVVGWFWLTN